MEILFENLYIRDKKLFKELYRYFFFRRPVIIACHIFALIALILTTVYVILFGWGRSCILCILLIIFMLWRILNYFLQVNSSVKRDREVFDEEPTVTTIVTDEYIEHTISAGAATQMKFDKIKRGFETKSLILLRTKANLMYIFPKESFSKGNAEEFKEFIRGKGIKIR